MSDIICAMCQECAHVDTCENPKTRDEVDAGRKPCKKYELAVEEEETVEDFDREIAEINMQFDRDHPESETDTDKEIPADKDDLRSIVDIPINEAGIISNKASAKYLAVKDKATESLANKFTRISGKRLTRALYELKLMAQFGRLHKQYDWTQEQADTIVLALRQAVDKVEQQLRR